MNIIIYILIGLILFLAFSIGSQDQTFASTVGSGAMSIKKSVIIGAIIAFIGTLILSSEVGKTIGVNLLGEGVNYTIEVVIAITSSTAIWLIFSSLKGIPISTTHTVVGAVFGIGFVWAYQTNQPLIASMNWNVIIFIFMGWVFSPLFGYLGAFFVSKFMKKSLKKLNKGFLHVEKYESTMRYLIIGFTCLNQLSRAGNDSGNAIGIIYSMVGVGEIDEELVIYITLLIAFLYSIGLLIIGKRVIKTVGFSTGDIRPSEAVSVEASTAIVLFIATVFGFPVSGTHIAVFSLFGNARTRGETPDRKALFKMIISWVVTFPIGALLSAVIYYGLTI